MQLGQTEVNSSDSGSLTGPASCFPERGEFLWERWRTERYSPRSVPRCCLVLRHYKRRSNASVASHARTDGLLGRFFHN
jgi:hypothetical protein